MNKTLFLILWTCFVSVSILAQENSIVYKGEKATKNIGSFDITISPGEEDKLILITVESKDIDNVILMFDKNYSAKDLKQRKIKFSKSFPGAKSMVCGSLYLEEIAELDAKSQRGIMSFSIPIDKNETIDYTFNYYLAEYKKTFFNRRKTCIFEKKEQKIQIHIELEDKAYQLFKQSADSLIKAIEADRFCIDTRHKDDIERKAEYKMAVKSLSNQIRKYITDNQIVSSDNPIFKELMDSLENIKYNTYNCGKHSTTNDRKGRIYHRHKCSYCGMDENGFGQAARSVWQKCRDKQISKNDALKQLNAMLTCARSRKLSTQKINKAISRL